LGCALVKIEKKGINLPQEGEGPESGIKPLIVRSSTGKKKPLGPLQRIGGTQKGGGGGCLGGGGGGGGRASKTLVKVSGSHVMHPS